MNAPILLTSDTLERLTLAVICERQNVERAAKLYVEGRIERAAWVTACRRYNEAISALLDAEKAESARLICVPTTRSVAPRQIHTGSAQSAEVTGEVSGMEHCSDVQACAADPNLPCVQPIGSSQRSAHTTLPDGRDSIDEGSEIGAPSSEVPMPDGSRSLCRLPLDSVLCDWCRANGIPFRFCDACWALRVDTWPEAAEDIELERMMREHECLLRETQPPEVTDEDVAAAAAAGALHDAPVVGVDVNGEPTSNPFAVVDPDFVPRKRDWDVSDDDYRRDGLALWRTR